MARPDVIAVYPITPQTPLAELLSKFYAQGQFDAELIEVEGENSSMGSVMGASAAGGRTFTATSSWGLAFMHDGLMFCSGMRLPVVMVNVTRETTFMRGVLSSRQDIMGMRDTGWIQIEAETCQEILDSILMAYRLAEDTDILVPVVVCYDGYYLSHLSERVDIPDQEQVNEFFKPLADMNRLRIEPGTNLQFAVSPLANDGELVAEYHYKHSQAMERVKSKLPDIEKEFHAIFGRSYGGLVDAYRTDDADIVFVTAGSAAGTVKVIVDEAREAGVKVGVARIRVFRPFPKQELLTLLQGKKAVGFIERSACFGWDCGHLYMETSVLRHQLPGVEFVDFIEGLGGMDISKDRIRRALAVLKDVASGQKLESHVLWAGIE